MTERYWVSTPFAAPFLCMPVGLGLLMLIVAPAPEKVMFTVLELVGPFVVGSLYVSRARSSTHALLRGAVVGLVAAVVTLISTWFAVRAREHDDVAPISLMTVAPFLLFAGPAFGTACTSLAIAVRWFIRRGRTTPF